MRLKAAKGAVLVDHYGQHRNVKEIMYRGNVIWPIYSLELSVNEIMIPASGDGSTIKVYRVARNEDGELISRTELTYQDVTISKTGADAIQNSVFTFYADNRGTTIGDVLTATYTITWRGYSAQLVVKQNANSRRQTARRNYFTLTETSGNVLTFLAGSKYEVDISSHRYQVGCYYEIDYLYKSGATFTDTLNGTIKSKSGSTSWSYSNGVLSIGSNGGSTSRTCTLTAYFPTSTYSGTLIVAQVKPAVIVYGVGWSSYAMRQVGGKKVFTFEITYNNNLRGASITFEAIKVNNGVTTTIRTMTATMSGNSFAVTDDSFAGNDATASGDAYYITFAYDSQTFTSPELDNAYYLGNARLAYSSGTMIAADGSNYAYVLADLMRGGTATQSGVNCEVVEMSASALYTANGRIYGPNRGTTTGAENTAEITSISYNGQTLAVSLTARQQANAIVSTAHSYDYVLTGLNDPFPASSPAAPTGETKGISYTSCKQYDTPTYTYTSGASATQSRFEVGSVSPSYSNTASWITMSGPSIGVAKQGKTGTARNATIEVYYGTIKLGEVKVYQAATTKTFLLEVSASASGVGAGGGSVTLSATGRTYYNNGDAAESTSITSGWSCTNSGSITSKWSVSGNTATAASLAHTETSAANNGTFRLVWNGQEKQITLAQAANTKTTAYTYKLRVNGTEYASGSQIMLSSSSHSSIEVYGLKKLTYTYAADPTNPVAGSTTTENISDTSLDAGYTWRSPYLSVTANTSVTSTRAATLIYSPDGGRYTVSFVQAKSTATTLYFVMSLYNALRVSTSPTSISLDAPNVTASISLTTTDAEGGEHAGTASMSASRSAVISYIDRYRGMPEVASVSGTITGTPPTGYTFDPTIRFIG